MSCDKNGNKEKDKEVASELIGKWESHYEEDGFVWAIGLEITKSTFQVFDYSDEILGESIKFEGVYTEGNKFVLPIVGTAFTWQVTGNTLTLTHPDRIEVHQKVSKFSWE